MIGKRESRIARINAYRILIETKKKKNAFALRTLPHVAAIDRSIDHRRILSGQESPPTASVWRFHPMSRLFEGVPDLKDPAALIVVLASIGLCLSFAVS